MFRWNKFVGELVYPIDQLPPSNWGGEGRGGGDIVFVHNFFFFFFYNVYHNLYAFPTLSLVMGEGRINAFI